MQCRNSIKIFIIIIALCSAYSSSCAFTVRSLLLRAQDNQYQIILDINLLSTSNLTSPEYLVSALFAQIQRGMNNAYYKDYLDKITSCSLLFDTQCNRVQQDFIDRCLDKLNSLVKSTYPGIKLVKNSIQPPGLSDYVSEDIDYIWSF